MVVLERLAGEPLGRAPLTPAQTASLGSALRRMYDIPLTHVAAAGISERLLGPSSCAQTVTDWLSEPHPLNDCQDAGAVAHAVETALAWLAEPGNLPTPHLVVLGIADLNPANVVWDGRTCRLVDFEDGGVSDPAYELADHVEHIASRLRGIFDLGTLVDAVGLSASERSRMDAYRRLWACFWLVMLLPGNAGFRRNPPGTTEAQAQHLVALID